MRLILASASPRRRELLRQAGIEFQARASSIEERRRPDETPEAYALRMAREKALDVAASSPAASLVLGADTVVVVEGEVLGKPASPEDAARMLRLLSGRTHRVMTGVCLIRAPGAVERLVLESTWVYFRSLDESEIQEYVASGEPFDKAGACSIQGLGSKFVTRIEGSYSNVCGLPVALVYDMVKLVIG